MTTRATPDEIDQLIATVREGARSHLIDQHRNPKDGAAYDPVVNAHHLQQLEALRYDTPDSPETQERIDAEAVRMLRITAANEDVDPEIRQRAKDALVRLRVPVEDPELAKKAADKELERISNDYAAKVWRAHNYGLPGPDMPRELGGSGGDSSAMSTLIRIHGSHEAAEAALSRARKQIKESVR